MAHVEGKARGPWVHQSFSDHVFVFVHGILSNSDACWTNDDVDPPSYWPDILAHDKRLGNPSVFLGGYFTAVDAGNFDIRAASDQVLAALRLPGVDGSEPPLSKKAIIFICHSTGGLVVRHILATQWDFFREKRLGLMLFAAPLRGSRWANILRLLPWLYGNRMAQELMVNDRFGREMSHQFSDVLNRKRLNIWGIEAYENRFIFHTKWIPNRMAVVTEKNLGYHFGPARLIPGTDHFSIVKPADIDHDSHKLVVNFFTENFSDLGGPSGGPRTKNGGIAAADREDVNRYFVGREDLIGSIRSCFADRGPSGAAAEPPSRMFWVHGFGGMGKTWLLIKAMLDIQGCARSRVHTAFLDYRRQDVPHHPVALFDGVAQALEDAFGTGAAKDYRTEKEKSKEHFDARATLEDKFDDLLSELQNLGPMWDTAQAGEARDADARDTVVLSQADRHDSLARLTEILKRHGNWQAEAHQLRISLATLKRRSRRFDQPRNDIVTDWIREEHRNTPGSDLTPNRLLADALQKAIQSCVAKGTAVLAFDNLESLAHELVEWLKIILVPVLETSENILVLVGSRWAPDSLDPSSSRQSWRARLGRSLLKVIDFNADLQLTPDEIRALLVSHGRAGDLDALATRIGEATEGLPLAIGMILDCPQHEAILAELKALSLDGESREALRDEIVGVVARRFLEELGNDDNASADLGDIVALTIVRSQALDLFALWWKRDDPERRIDDLSRRYSFMSERRVHPTVATYLRKEWRKRPLPCHPQVVDTLIEAGEQTLAHEPFLSREWREAAVELANIRSWRSRDGAAWEVLKWICVFLCHELPIDSLCAIGEELEPLSGEACRAQQVIVDLGKWAVWNISESTWNWLADLRPLGWSDVELAHLAVILAIHHPGLNDEERWRRLATALPKLPSSAVESEPVVQSVLRVARAFPSQDQRVAAIEALGVSSLCNRRRWNDDLYWVLHDLGRYEEAKAFCGSVLEADPDHIGARAFLSHLLAKHLGDAPAAEKVLKDRLKLRPDDVNLNFFMAQTLEMLPGRQVETAHHYRKAMEVAIGPEKRQIEEHLIVLDVKWSEEPATPELLERVRAAIRQDGVSPSGLNSLAWALYLRGADCLELAEEAAIAAVNGDANEASLHTLAAILVRRDAWPEAEKWVRRWLDQVNGWRLRANWQEFQPLFDDAIAHGRVEKIVGAAGPRGDDPHVKAILTSVKSATSGPVKVDWPKG